MTTTQDARRSAPAALRNRNAILEVLRPQLPSSGLVLEVASGSGEHLVHFARQMPELSWQPSDASEEARQSISAWLTSEMLPNTLPPLDLDAARAIWPVAQATAVICINMIHISPWEATVGLMQGARSTLSDDGLLYLYGPYRRAERELEPSNKAFDQDLRSRNPRWGLRELESVIACAAAHNLRFDRVIEMPANNLSVLFRKSAAYRA